MLSKNPFALVPVLIVLFCAFVASHTAIGQSVTSTAYESYLNSSNLTDGSGNPVNIYPVAFNTNTLAPATVQYGIGFSQPDYVTGADNEIAILSLGTVYQPTFTGDIFPARYAGPFNTYAYGDYGSLHAYAYVNASNDSYFYAVSSSSFTDGLTVSSGNVTQTPTYEKFVFDVDGSITGTGGADLRVSAYDSQLPGTAVRGTVATSQGNLTSIDELFDQSFGSTVSDDFNFSGSGQAVLTTQGYSITNGLVTPTVTLSATSNAELYGSAVGTADFSDTVTLANILVYDQNGDQIANSDLTFSDTSGAKYSFMSGLAPVPEASTFCSFLLGLVAILSFVICSPLKRAQIPS